MKKLIHLVLALLLLQSCVTVKFNRSKVDVYTFKPNKLQTNMSLGNITIEPVHSINGLEAILPEIITSVASGNSLTINSAENDSDPVMDVYLHTKSYVKNFQKYESVTLMLKITDSNGVIANTIYTNDSKIPLDSFAQVYDIFNEVMSEIHKEYTEIQEEMLKEQAS